MSMFIKGWWWKCALTVSLLAWAGMALFPIKDTPFAQYAASLSTQDAAGFDALVTQAQHEVDAGISPSVYVALRNLGQTRKIDLATYFPNIDLADIHSIEKRNDLLLTYLLQSSQGKLKLGLDLEGGVAFTLKVDARGLGDRSEALRAEQLNQAIEILGSRINGLGVVDPVIRALGDSAIEVQLPGVSTQENPDVLASLQKPAKLTFHSVLRTQSPKGDTPDPIPGYVVMSEISNNPKTGEQYTTRLYVKRIPEMGGEMVKDAFVSVNEYGAYQINLNFTQAGTERFKQVTGLMAKHNSEPAYSTLPDSHPGRYARLAIVLDGQLYSAPRVTEAIPNGSARITGSFSQREAFELANVLNNPLEIPLVVDEMYEVGPTLAEGARQSAIYASIAGGALVTAFMVLYYGIAGLISMISVAMNIFVVLGVMASLGATLTLPGVAALVLTIGMAVDSNILIFERIREEIKAGKSIASAVAAGFDKAFSTILDANLTTLLVAGILIWLGTGPIKGFGVTLAIGICATLFCALIVSQMFLELLVHKANLKRLFLFSFFKETTFNFMGARRLAFMISWVVVLAGVISLGFKGREVFGVDFLGGDELTCSFTRKITTQAILQTAKSEGIASVTPLYQVSLGDHSEKLRLQTPTGQGQALLSALQTVYPEAQLKLLGTTHIGATVSEHIQWNAFLSFSLALVGILIYVAFRFEMGYGAGAVIALLHDVLMSVGIFVLLGHQFSAPMVAAVLMIIGYSINDKIVVFDRIREELLLNPVMKLFDVINLSVNRTLSRTTLTSLTTLLSALALYLFGGAEIQDFALLFILGIVIGTFSSIFIASPIFYWWHKGDRRHAEERELVPKYAWDASSRDAR